LERAEDSASKIRCKAALCELGIPSALAVGAVKEILKDLLLAYTIPVFSKRAKRLLISHLKFYIFDSGIYRAMRKTAILDTQSKIDGTTLEGLVFQHLNTWCEYTKEKNELFFWQTKAGLEVDFILYGQSGFWAIEVKNSTKIFPTDLRGLIHFSQDYPECKTVLIYRGKDRLKIKNILCLSCEDFLKNIYPNKPIF
jgi:predicted AAA+ superfamily ATPase